MSSGRRLFVGIVAGGLLLELGWAVADQLQLVDRGVRGFNRLRAIAHP